MTKYVAYTDLGNGVGAPVDPDDHGGEGSDEWQYLVDHRVVVPAGDPDAPAPPEGYEVVEKKGRRSGKAGPEEEVEATGTMASSSSLGSSPSSTSSKPSPGSSSSKHG
jgi:hypothetical protein